MVNAISCPATVTLLARSVNTELVENDTIIFLYPFSGQPVILTQIRLYSCYQFIRGEWLCHIVIRPHAESPHFIDLVCSV